MKKCSRCLEEKAFSEFGKSSKAKDGYQWHCRACKTELHQLNHSQRMKSITASKAMRVARNQNWAWNYLINHPCVVCGQRQPRYLDFDHTEPKYKTHDISFMVSQGYSIEALEKEAEKCTIKCLYCHRDRTVEQFGWWVGNHVLIEA